MCANYSELEKQCENCHGEGIVDGGLCVICHGERVVLTEFGERLADLIDRRVSVALRRFNCIRD
jgi:hypothetical protein